MRALLIISACTLISSVSAQFKIGGGVHKTFVDLGTELTRDYGVSLEGYYQFLDSTRPLRLESGIGFSYQWYSHIDHYSNILLSDDPSYVPDYSERYIHRTQNSEMVVPVLVSYVYPLGSLSLRAGLGIRTRIVLSSRSSVSLDNMVIVEGSGMRIQEAREKIAFNDTFFIGAQLGSWELRLLSDGLLMSELRRNGFYYYYTDKRMHLASVSLTLLYTL